MTILVLGSMIAITVGLLVGMIKDREKADEHVSGRELLIVKLTKALIEATENNILNYNELGGCDHSVGICACGEYSMICDHVAVIEEVTGRTMSELTAGKTEWTNQPDIDPIDFAELEEVDR